MKHLEKYAPIIAAVAMLYAIGNGGLSLFDSLKSGERKLTRVQKYKTVKSSVDGKVMKLNYTHIPYNLNFSLY